MTLNQIQLWESAAGAFDIRHRAIEPQHHDLPTPCDDFDVAALIEHAVHTQVVFGQALGGTAAIGVSWNEARAAMANALAQPGSIDGTIDHPALGEVTRERMLGIATNDLLIHTWDISRSLGIDEALPEVNLQPAIDGIEAFPPPVRAALFSAPLDASNTANLQEQMLAVAGRRH